MLSKSERERLTSAPRRARDRGVDAPYRVVRDLAVDGRFPAHQVNGIWHYFIDDLDAIIAAVESRRAAITLHRAA